MLNKKMIEKFKQIEKIIDNCDFFQFYTFDKFIECQNECMYENCFDENDNDFIHYQKQIETLKTKYHCNNDNTIIFLYRDVDEYLLLNFEYDTKIIMQNVDIENVNDECTNNALYHILCELFTNEYCCM